MPAERWVRNGEKRRSRALPETDHAARVLGKVLGQPGAVEIVRRQKNPFGSTSPTEIVTCRLADGRARRLFCKYRGDYGEDLHGHKGGPEFEAWVHQRLLRRLGHPGVFLGAHPEPQRARLWLVFRYIEGFDRLQKVPHLMPMAARWLGGFHAAGERLAARGRCGPLPVYDAAYYLEWARRTLEFAGKRPARRALVARLCAAYAQAVPLLLAAAPTIIHGEFYPPNVLVEGQAIQPVDWESAAIGPGAVDLASMTERWSAGMTRKCLRAYQEARWPGGAPASFERTLLAARMYLSFRWLGAAPEALADPDELWRLRYLRGQARLLELARS